MAYRLLDERRFALRYETYAAGKTRGPDFTVIYKERPAYNVEVKRLRGALDAGAFGKWGNAVCDKVAQMPPSIPNVVLIGAQGRDAASYDAAGALARLRRLAEGGDDAFFARAAATRTRATSCARSRSAPCSTSPAGMQTCRIR